MTAIPDFATAQALVKALRAPSEDATWADRETAKVLEYILDRLGPESSSADPTWIVFVGNPGQLVWLDNYLTASRHAQVLEVECAEPARRYSIRFTLPSLHLLELGVEWGRKWPEMPVITRVV